MVYHDKPNQNVKDIIPVADSMYKNVKIPIILITKEDGEILIQKGKDQNISFVLDMDDDVAKEETLNVELWLNPTNLKSYDFLNKFHKVFK